MRRTSLSIKLLAAVVPALLALAALVAIGVRDGRESAREARLGATLGATWEPLVTTMRVIETERAASAGDAADRAAITDARRATNAQMVTMGDTLIEIADGRSLVDQLGETLTALGLAREAVDQPAQAAARGVSAADSYDAAEANLVAVGALLPTQAADTDLARDLTVVAALAEVEQRAAVVADRLAAFAGTTPDAVELDRLIARIDAIGPAVAQYRVVAGVDGLEAFRATGLSRSLDDARRGLVAVATGADAAAAVDATNDDAAGDDATSDAATTDVVAPVVDPALASGIVAPVAAVADLRDAAATDVVVTSDARAVDLDRATWVRAGIIAAVAFLVTVLALWITTSISRRVRRVSRAAQNVTETALPALVDALHDPRGAAALPEMAPIDARGRDEVAELARSFTTLQHTLGEVAAEQIEVLHRGVSDLFVTMARRNRGLVDRQLSLLDELEGEVTDPDVLADYYRLDHLATRMRRNSDSLLVLAGAETSRRRIKATGIDTVVRAAVGEVEDYLRVDIVELDRATVRGVHVADLAHLLAELIDNATSFSPPDSRVRVEGSLGDEEYRITITDQGMGMSGPRVRSINTMLATPPVVGLSVESTLGMSVVSLLAARHGFRVRLSSGEDGTVVEVRVPVRALEGVSTPVPARSDHEIRVTDDTPPSGVGRAPETASTPATEPVVIDASLADPRIGRPAAAAVTTDDATLDGAIHVDAIRDAANGDDVDLDVDLDTILATTFPDDPAPTGTPTTEPAAALGTPPASPASDTEVPGADPAPARTGLTIDLSEFADLLDPAVRPNPFATPPTSSEPLATLPPPAPTGADEAASSPRPEPRPEVAGASPAPPPDEAAASFHGLPLRSRATVAVEGQRDPQVPDRPLPPRVAPEAVASRNGDGPPVEPTLPQRTAPTPASDPVLPQRAVPQAGEQPTSESHHEDSTSVRAGASSPTQLGRALSAFTEGRRGHRPDGPRLDGDAHPDDAPDGGPHDDHAHDGDDPWWATATTTRTPDAGNGEAST